MRLKIETLDGRMHCNLNMPSEWKMTKALRLVHDLARCNDAVVIGLDFDEFAPVGMPLPFEDPSCLDEDAGG